MVLEDKTTYRNILGGLMKNPELFNHYPDIRPEDFFGLKLASTIFIVMYNMFVNGATKLSPEEIDLEIERHETLNVIYKENGGLDYLKFCYDTEIDNFSYYYKRLKKLALLHELRKNGYNIGKYYKEVFSSLREEEEAIQRFELATTDDILNEIEQNFATIKNEYVNRNKGGSAATGMTELVESFKLIPDIGPALEGDIYSTCCRGARAGKFYLRSANQGVGKALPNYVQIPLANGEWKKVGEVVQGDYLIGRNGKPTKVLAIHPQKEKKEIYKVTLSDGRVAECCKEHLWEYHIEGIKKVGTTLEIIKQLRRNKIYLPLNAPVEYQKRIYTLSPKLIGIKIRNGSKKIPEEYLYGNIEQRQELLNGILDIEKDTKKEFIVFNEILAEQVQQLCYSLGYSVLITLCKALGNSYKFNIQKPKEDNIEIIKIEKTGIYTDMTCFTVDAEDALFCRNDYIVTHNTRLTVFDACKLCYPVKWSFEDKAFVVEQREGKNREPIKVLVITTEMGRDEIQTIILSYLSGVNERKILTGSYDDEEWERIQYAIKIADDYKQYFFLEEIPDPNLTNVEALIKKYIVIEHIQACMYDYIFTSPSLIGQFQNAKMREDSALQLMANKLKEIATTYNIYVQSSTQLNAEGMTREGFKDGTCLRGR